MMTMIETADLFQRDNSNVCFAIIRYIIYIILYWSVRMWEDLKSEVYEMELIAKLYKYRS